MFSTKLFFVLIALTSATHGKVIKEQVLPQGYPNVHKISSDNGVLQCGDVTCPKGSYRCSIESESDKQLGLDGGHNTITTMTRCLNKKFMTLRTHTITMRSPKEDMTISIKTSGSIDGVEANSSKSEQGSLPMPMFSLAKSERPSATSTWATPPKP